MKKFIASLLITSMTFSSVAFGEPPTAEKVPPAVAAPSATAPPLNDPAMISPLKQGQPAPFPGVLFSPRAAASVAADISTFQERIKIEVAAAVRLSEAQKDYKYNELNTTCVADKSRFTATVEANEKRIKILETDLDTTRRETPNTTLWFGLGAGAGVVVTVLTVFAVSQATK